MALALTEEQRMLRDSARELMTNKAPVTALRKLRDDNDPDGFSRELWRELAELGWCGMALPESYGGSAFGFQGIGIAFEEAGRTLASTPMMSTVLLGASLIEQLGSEATKASLLPAIVAGEHITALALEEQPRHNPLLIRTRAERDADRFILNGSKILVLDGHVADSLLIVARSRGADDDADGLSVFCVPADTTGITVTRTQMVDSRNAANIALDNVRVSAEMLLGAESGAAFALDVTLDRARVALAAEMLGSAEEAFDRTLAYLKMREQFGVLIGTFQGLKHRAAIMFCELELLRSAVYAALGAIEANDPQSPVLASLAKSQACKTFELVSAEAVQMHGGIGMTDEEEIGFFLKRARVAMQTFGDASYHRDRYARLSGY
jgi:acyl-CoA dehydrogenase